MQKPVLIEGQEIKLATITVGDLEEVDLSGKTGRKFNIAMIAASIRAAGDLEHGTEAWVRTVHAFDPEGGDPPFQLLLEAGNEVNGFNRRKEKNAPEPGAPAAG